MARNHALLVIDLRPGATPARLRQYPTPREARLEIQKHIQHLHNKEILIEYQSPWNMPLLPIKKVEGKDYRPVQDL